MTAAAVVAFGVFAAFAVGDWISRATDNRTLELVTKPLATLALVAAALAIDPADESRRWWFVIALVLSLAGDVALLDDSRFVLGLGAFALAHVAYVIGFWVDPPSVLAIGVGLVITAAVIVPIGRRVLGSVRASEPALVGPVVLYIAVIGAMLASALASGVLLAAVGAALFATSDSMIAWNKFVRPFAAASVAIMVTYHLGQAGLVLSLL